MGGILVKSFSDVQLGPRSECGAALGGESALPLKIKVVEKDFIASYEDNAKAWTVQWRWAGDEEPGHLLSRITECHVPVAARREYEAELEKWIKEGWLLFYDEKEFRKLKELIPLSRRTRTRFGPC